MNFSVSVIVPVYGVEQYVKLCVDSILNQTLKDLEVIVVNDCTKDNSMKICEEFYGSNERVQLINQPRNMGVGEARNTGLLHARGKYVAFIDGDDQVMPEMFEEMFNAAEKFDADVVHSTGVVGYIPAQGNEFPIDMLDPEKSLVFKLTNDAEAPEELTLLDDDLGKRLEGWVKHKYHWGVWNHIYKKDFLIENNIHFAKMKLAEDLLFSLECLFSAKRFVIVPGQWYVYRVTAASSSRSTDNVKKTLKTLEAQVLGVENMNAVLSRIPFFKDNRNNMRIVIEHMLKSLDDGYIRFAYQSSGEDSMRSSEELHEFFVNEFGIKAEYVEFLFHELHKNYPQVSDIYQFTSNPELWEVVRKNYSRYKETGSLAVLFEGFGA